MSKVNIYTIYDKIAEESGPVFTAKNDGIALRQTQHLISQNQITPEDYMLLKLAIYDTESVAMAPILPVEEVDITNLIKLPQEAENE